MHHQVFILISVDILLKIINFFRLVMNNETNISEQQNDFVINHSKEDVETSRKIIEKLKKDFNIEYNGTDPIQDSI